ncbi:FkbM family methyltransferase [Nibrella viscosa]
MNWLRQYNIKTVIDIGANVGQFAREISGVLPQAHIHSFEPLDVCHEELKNNTRDLDITIHPYGLGDANYQTAIHLHQHSPSSSLLKMNDLHEEVFPNSKAFECRPVQVKRLDDVLSRDTLEDNILIKADVQGFEDKVISGGRHVFSQAKVLIIETSFEPFYEQQVLFDDLYAMLRDLNFSFRGNLWQESHPHDGRVLHSDSIFIKH